MTNQIVTVLGGTGLQGSGVVNALLAAGNFAVRVASRNPASDAARTLSARGVEVVKADLLEPGSLGPVLEGAHGAPAGAAGSWLARVAPLGAYLWVTASWSPTTRARPGEMP